MASFVQTALGKPRDWNIHKPTFRKPRLSLALVGPILIIASIAVSWPAFSGATGEDRNVAFGLFIGATSILLMAWSFLLSIRIKFIEPIFGGLDGMYRIHRWIGTLAVVAMFLHTSVEPEIDGGIKGASESIADSARDLAGVGEIMLYILVGISLIRWFPYRYWRLTHKLLGIPFAFACWHFYTEEKPYANGSGWGIYFAAFMIVGLGAYFIRVLVKDIFLPGLPYEVSKTERNGTTTEIQLASEGKKLKYRAGQFAVIKIQKTGLREPHVFTIASSPNHAELKFFIRDLGDWTNKIQAEDLVGTKVLVEGPYGEFRPLPHKDLPTYWIAGGVGITPFLSVIETLEPSENGSRPTLFYCVQNRDDATALHAVQKASSDGRINLEWFESSKGRRFTGDLFQEVINGQDLKQAHVAVCGPAGLVANTIKTSQKLGANHIESEDFDIRSGFGPDLSQTFANLLNK